MSGGYLIRNPYPSSTFIGVGGDPVPIDVGYDEALAKEEEAQPGLDGGESQMYAIQNNIENFLLPTELSIEAVKAIRGLGA